jgi:hypothetical protein
MQKEEDTEVHLLFSGPNIFAKKRDTPLPQADKKNASEMV